MQLSRNNGHLCGNHTLIVTDHHSVALSVNKSLFLEEGNLPPACPSPVSFWKCTREYIHAQCALKEPIAYSVAPAKGGRRKVTREEEANKCRVGAPLAAFQTFFSCSSRFNQQRKLTHEQHVSSVTGKQHTVSLTQGNHELTMKCFDCLATNSRESSCKEPKLSCCALRLLFVL